ncbi:hypothetical protein DFH06DRAFT_1253115 [Mycena polygramma]|nr:hypothetical protein DFH06DRAFT_1253115 [Mycena polygramma]
MAPHVLTKRAVLRRHSSKFRDSKRADPATHVVEGTATHHQTAQKDLVRREPSIVTRTYGSTPRSRHASGCKPPDILKQCLKRNSASLRLNHPGRTQKRPMSCHFSQSHEQKTRSRRFGNTGKWAAMEAPGWGLSRCTELEIAGIRTSTAAWVSFRNFATERYPRSRVCGSLREIRKSTGRKTPPKALPARVHCGKRKPL